MILYKYIFMSIYKNIVEFVIIIKDLCKLGEG